MSNDISNAIPTVNVQMAPQFDSPSDPAVPMQSGSDHLGVDPSVDDLTQSVVQPGQALSVEPTELLGRITKKVGKVGLGGYSDVFSGTWTSPSGEEFPVAIKVLRALPGDQGDRNKKRVLREGAIWKMAEHNNIVKFYGVQTAGELSLVSEWCSNGSLLRYLKERPSISLLSKLRLLQQAGKALVYMHHELKHPIYHGDIKPDNVLVRDNGEAAFCDLGVSRVAHALNWTTGLTSSNPYEKGSKGYQAPEVLDPQKPEAEEDDHTTNKDRHGQPSAPADVYAFAGLILAVLSGRNPFEKFNAYKTLISVAVHKQRPQRIDHPLMPATWWPFLDRCWSFESNERPSMRQVVEELQRAIAIELASSSD